LSDRYKFNVKKKRPEEIYPNVSDYFKGEMLKRYANSKSIIKIQERITIRALELLNLKKKEGLILDAGTGPGFSAIYLNEIGYRTVAIDIIPAFLNYYEIRDINPIASDMCFTPFKSNTFDAIISISALQWIFRDNNNPIIEDLMKSLFKSFFQILKPNSKAIFQFYPKSSDIMEEIGRIVKKSTAFSGEFVIDNPNTKKKRKIYLLLDKNE
jgi:18S rRNA (guanine1575-N7)-methyltransferase